MKYEQEPVAWMVYVAGHSNQYCVDDINDAQLVDDCTNHNAEVTPLYAAPVEIEVLTKERDDLPLQLDMQAGSIDAVQAANQRLAGERDTLTSRLNALEAAAKLALEALTHYANTYNWDEDFHGIRRKWLEPETSTPRAYNGFELAQKTLAALKKAGVQ
jgi:hypothetical protein